MIEKIRRFLSIFILITGLAFLPGCAGFLPVPGGDETTNEAFYETDEDLLGALNRLKPGMSKDRTFSILMRTRDDFEKMDRLEIIKILYGGSDVELAYSLAEQNGMNHLLESLDGYRFSFKIVERHHGFTSPIRMKTRETGYHYTVTLIFRDGILFDDPVLSGGPVNNTSSSTIFDYLSPSVILSRSGV